MKHETIIIGGGMAGMSCALRLKKNNKDYLLITDRLGGRVLYSKKYKINFGAVFYMKNYFHAKKILTHGPRLKVKLSELMLHNSDDVFFPMLSLRMMKNIPQMLRFLRYIKKFTSNYEIYKKDCETMTVEQALSRNPFINRLFNMRAKIIITENKIERISEDFISKFAYACTGALPDELTALDFLNVAQGIYLPIYDFSFDEDTMAEQFGDNLLIDSVDCISGENNLYTVTTKNGKTFQCRNLVVATPASVTQKLLNIPEIRKPTSLCTYLIKGKLNAKYSTKRFHYFSDSFEVIAIGDKETGPDEYIVFSSKEVNLNDFFIRHEIIKMQKWDEAMFIHGDFLLKQNFRENLYTAGDHNGLGMEPACISGIYAANQIINSK